MHHLLRYWMGLGVSIPHIVSLNRHGRLSAIKQGHAVFPLFSHNPKAEVVESVVTWLLKHQFVFLTRDELIAHLTETRTREGRYAWLSFDDGWADNLNHVIPFLTRLNIPATFFIAPQATLEGSLWSDLIPASYSSHERERFFHMDNAERIQLAQTWYKQQTGDKRRLMTREDIIRLSHNKLFNFENHTYTHCSCVAMTPEAILDEVRKADDCLSSWTGQPTKLVCYPYGKWTASGDALLRTQGWLPVFSSPGMATEKKICRNLFYDAMSFCENSCRLVGAWKKIKEPEMCS